MDDFFTKFKVLAGLTNQFIGFEEDVPTIPASEAPVVEQVAAPAPEPEQTDEAKIGATQRRKDGMWQVGASGTWNKVKTQKQKAAERGKRDDRLGANVRGPRAAKGAARSKERSMMKDFFSKKFSNVGEAEQQGPIASRMALLLSRPIPRPVDEAKATKATAKKLAKLHAADLDVEISGDTLTIWFDNDSADAADAAAKKIAQELGGATVVTAGTKKIIHYKGDATATGDWNDPSSKHHY